MSIIQEALRKAEAKTFGRKGAAVTPPVTAAGDRTPPAVKSGKEIPSGAPAVRQAKLSVGLRLTGILAAVLLVVFSVSAGLMMHRQVVKPAGEGGEALPALKDVAPPEPSTGDTGAMAGATHENISPAVTGSDFNLNGIMYVEGDPRAIVNNAMVGVGDRVDGARVIRIERRSVVLDREGAEITLDLK